jgi:hypothetical protein
LYTLGIFGLTPLSFALAGVGADRLGPQSVLVLGGALVALCGALVFGVRGRRAGLREARAGLRGAVARVAPRTSVMSMPGGACCGLLAAVGRKPGAGVVLGCRDCHIN